MAIIYAEDVIVTGLIYIYIYKLHWPLEVVCLQFVISNSLTILRQCRLLLRYVLCFYRNSSRPPIASCGIITF